jgi:hypothetical protein
VIADYSFGDLLNLEGKSAISPKIIEMLLLLDVYDNTTPKVLSDTNTSEFRDFVSGNTICSSRKLDNLEPLLW